MSRQQVLLVSAAAAAACVSIDKHQPSPSPAERLVARFTGLLRGIVVVTVFNPHRRESEHKKTPALM
jgi:hypothetical protein